MRSSPRPMTRLLLALALLAPAPLAAEPVANVFQVSVRATGLTEGRRYSFTFRLFAEPVGGTPLFEEAKSYTVPPGRVIRHALGSVNVATPLRAEDFLQQLWIEASVPNRAPFPRVKLGPEPLAIGSQNADLLDGMDAADFAPEGHGHASVPAAGDADTLDGQDGVYYLDAGNLTGSLADGRLSGNVALLDAAQTVTGAKTFNPPLGAPPFAVHPSNAAAVANLNADQLDGLHGSDYRNASSLNAGTVGTDRYSALADLAAEGHLGDAAGDLARNNGTLQATLYAERSQRADELAAGALAALDLRYRSAPLLPGLGGYAVSTVESTPAPGADSSIGVTIGSDGLPVIAYADLVADVVRLLHCDDDACTSGTLTVVAALGGAGAIGMDVALTIGTDGFPLIAYFDDFTFDLKLVRCGDVVCGSRNTLSLDTAGVVGMDPSITTGADGYPVISYWDISTGNLKVYHCSAADCSSGASTAPDTDGSVGSASSIAIGAGGFPVVSYWDSTNTDLKLLLCGDAACAAGNSVVTADGPGDVGSSTSVAIGADGLPVVAYYDAGNMDLKVFHCGNAACSGGNTATTVDSAGDVGLFCSITIGARGLPVVSYQDATGFNLKVLHCGNAACTSGNTVRTLDSAESVGWNTSATSGADGIPLIAYWDFTNADVKLARGFIRPLGRR